MYVTSLVSQNKPGFVFDSISFMRNKMHTPILMFRVTITPEIIAVISTGSGQEKWQNKCMEHQYTLRVSTYNFFPFKSKKIYY